MPLESATVPAVKRAACDRCRGQKLRCLSDVRGNELQKCNRCRAAKAECIHSPAKNTGRPPASNRPKPPHGRTGLGQASDGPSDSRNPCAEPASISIGDEPGGLGIGGASNLGKRVVQHHPLLQPRGTGNPHASAMRPYPEAFDVDSPPDDDVNLTSIPCYAREPTRPGHDGTFDLLSALSPLSDSVFSPFVAWNDMPAEDASLVTPYASTLGHAIEAGNVDDDQPLWQDGGGKSATFEAFNPVVDYPPAEPAARYAPGHGPPIASPTATRQHSPSADSTATSAISRGEVIQECMRQLSELGVRLSAQVNQHGNDRVRHEHLSGNGAAVTRTQPLERLTAQVLESSTTLLAILASLQQVEARSDTFPTSVAAGYADPVSSNACMTPVSLDREHHRLTDSPSGARRNPSHQHSASSSSSSSSSSTHRSNVTSSSTIPSKPALDTATTLQLLIVYIRLIQLHHLFYSTVYQHLVRPPPPTRSSQPSSTTVATMPPPFPALSFGGVSLAAYPRFQYKFLLQICVHRLGEVEAAVGLPAGLRISKAAESGGAMERCGGALGGAEGGTVVLVRTVMMEAEGKLQAIREVLGRLRELLRGSIDV